MWINIKPASETTEPADLSEIYESLESLSQKNKPKVLYDNHPHYPEVLTADMEYRESNFLHPDVIYFENGFGGYKYWLVMTPMPEAYENPCILVSNNGINFKEPVAGINPLVPKPEGTGFNSDPDMVFVNGTFYLYYREVLVIEEEPLLRTETIFLIKSTDGINWSSPIQCHQEEAGAIVHNFISPSVIYDDGTFYMFAYSRIDGTRYIGKSTSADGETWTPFEGKSWTGLSGGGEYPWHLDCVLVDGVIYCATSINETGSGLYFGKSTDMGETWAFNTTPFMSPSHGFEGDRFYRPSLRNIPGTNLYEMWCSGVNPGVLTYIPLILVNDDFVPLEINSVFQRSAAKSFVQRPS